MRTSAACLVSAAVAALVGATAVTTGANGAAKLSSPAEKTTTAELNRKLLAETVAKDAQAKAQYEEQVRQQKMQYDEQKRTWEKQQADYQAKLQAAKSAP